MVWLPELFSFDGSDRPRVIVVGALAGATALLVGADALACLGIIPQLIHFYRLITGLVVAGKLMGQDLGDVLFLLLIVLFTTIFICIPILFCDFIVIYCAGAPLLRRIRLNIPRMLPMLVRFGGGKRFLLGFGGGADLLRVVGGFEDKVMVVLGNLIAGLGYNTGLLDSFGELLELLMLHIHSLLFHVSIVLILMFDGRFFGYHVVVLIVLVLLIGRSFRRRRLNICLFNLI